MPRIPLLDRLEILDEHLGHWAEADTIAGVPIEIAPAFGRVQLQALRDQYHAMEEAITQLEGDLDVAQNERDGLWGTSPEDDDGVWFRLKQYKVMVRARLGARHPLTRTVPNLGTVTPRNYLDIVHRFIDHWERVNALLTPDLTLGSFTLANLQTAHANLDAKIAQVDSVETTLRVRREEREQLFGDEPEELREETSIIARLLLYHATIEATFPNQPIADSLPNIFPVGPETPLPTFDFNWVTQPGSQIKTWLESPNLAGAALVAIKEGAVELTEPFDPAAPGGIQVNVWSGVLVVDELDELELRNGDGITIARGVRNMALPEPAGV